MRSLRPTPHAAPAVTALERVRLEAGLEHARLRAWRSSARGFTLLELLTVIAIISVLAVVASPRVVQVIRDRRVQGVARDVADVYRFARSRALGRGSAVLVRYSATGGTGGRPLFEVREAIASAASPLPSASCFTDWTNGGLTSRALRSLDVGVQTDTFLPGAEWAGVEARDVNGAAQPTTEICFTPRGRAYARFGAGAPFAAMTGVPQVMVTNNYSQFQRPVFIPPNGHARVQL